METVYRVYYLPENLRKQLKAKREKHNITVQAVIKTATAESLPKIVATLKTNGLGFDGRSEWHGCPNAQLARAQYAGNNVRVLETSRIR